jgi:hypothetical protein
MSIDEVTINYTYIHTYNAYFQCSHNIAIYPKYILDPTSLIIEALVAVCLKDKKNYDIIFEQMLQLSGIPN